jgi:hypothetical protein
VFAKPNATFGAIPEADAAEELIVARVDDIEIRARASGHWAVPGRCEVPSCANRSVFPSAGLCPVHSHLIDEFERWLAFGDFEQDRLGLVRDLGIEST